MKKLQILPLVLAAALAGCGTDESAATSSDIVIRNDGSVPLARILVNGVDHGGLAPGSVLALEDVGSAAFLIQAYREGDAAPCGTYQTPVLARGQIVHHAFDCTR